MGNDCELSQQERVRYSRHLILPEVGARGQTRLKHGKVLVVGVGGLGSPAILYLAASGVGTLGIVDFDAVEESNLQRQIIFDSRDVGSSKIVAAAKRAADLNPHVRLVKHEEKLGAKNVLGILADYDVIVDGTDNFPTRYLINDACVLLGKPNVYGSIYRFEGQASVFISGQGPCYRCLFPLPPEDSAIPNCAEGGVLGVMAGVIGVIQATEAIKLLLGKGTSLAGRLLLYDAMEMRFETIKIERSAGCPVCGDNPSITTVGESAASCAAHREPQPAVADISAAELAAELAAGKKIFLLDVRNKEEYEHCHLPDSRLIPLPQLGQRVGELDPQADIVVYCKGGIRSRKAIEILSAGGFTRVRNLQGGILSWARDVDPAMSVY